MGNMTLTIDAGLVGRVVHGGRLGRYGIITGATEGALNCFTLGTGRMKPAGRDVSILWDNLSTSTLPESIISALPYRLGDVLDADGIAEFKRAAGVRKAKEQAKARARQAILDDYWQNIRAGAEHDKLTKVSDGSRSSIAVAAANIRKELKIIFRGQKFSVQCRHGSSINIDWEFGPTSALVDTVVNKYQYGDFDAMTDCYNSKEDRRFCDTYGGARYVFTHRSFPDGFMADALAMLQAVTDCASAQVDHGQNMLWKRLSGASFQPGDVLHGFMWSREDCDVVPLVGAPK